MTLGPIQELIDKQDNFEIIRDEIAAILAVETASQQALATAAGEDPNDWKFLVYLERSNPWERYLNSEDQTPIVNVWFDSTVFDEAASNNIKQQKGEGVFNIDCYGRGLARADGAGHVAGDKEASTECHRVVRLVRNILMSSYYTYLDMRGVVWRRWIQSINIFQPQDTERAAQQVVAGRIALSVHYNEFSPQYVAETLELLSAQVTRASDGLVYAEADYDYTM